MISKELLNAVLGCCNINYDYVIDTPRLAEYDKTTLVYKLAIDKQRNENRYINIYELAFKCKAWALSNGFILESRIRGYCKGKALCVIYKDDWTSEFEEHCLYTCEAETEIFAIFKGCEWILNKLREEK